MEIKEELGNELVKATERVRKMLIPLKNLNSERMINIIGGYTAAIEGNFTSWLGASAISARSLEARYVAEENLQEEIRANHQGMLRKFAIDSNAEPSHQNYRWVYEDVEKMRKLVAEMSGLKNVTLMAYLENTSAAFIPYLAEIGKELKCKDFTYTNVHGEADIQHANQFLWALKYEMSKGYSEPKKEINQVIERGYLFLDNIFTC